MVYAVILAGGTGSRMGNQGMPKQFLTLNDKPIIIHTLEKYIRMKFIDKFIIVCHKEYCRHMHNLLIEYNFDNDILIIEGGESRIQSIQNGVRYLIDNYKITNDDIFISIDSVRPFVDEKEIINLVDNLKIYNASTIVSSVSENIIKINENNEMIKIYSRKNMYKDLSPQAFKVLKFYELLNKVSEEDKIQITDLCELFVRENEKVKIVEGTTSNIKITTPIDLKIARELIKEEN